MPKERRKIKLTDKGQSARFVSAAKSLGRDKTGEAFERAMDSLDRKKPKK